MQDIFRTMIQSIVSILILFVFTRVMGKKQISHLTLFDYVVGISIGSIAGEFAVNSSIHYKQGITSLVVYALFPLVLSSVSLRSYKARKLLDGTPTILIQDGIVIESNLKKSKLTVNDLLEECRLKNAFNISEIEFAILETSGKVSIQLKAQNLALTAKDMNLYPNNKGLCINVIIDGLVFTDKLAALGKDDQWLSNELKKKNINNPKEVLLAYVDASNQLFVYLKSPQVKVIPLM